MRLKVSAAHKSRQILPAYEKGELRCRFDGEPLSITWKKVGLRGLPNRMIPEMDKLNIQDVDMRDGGMYKCQAYDGFLTVEAEISVIVNGKSSLEKICRNLFFSVPKRKLVGYHFMRKNAQMFQSMNMSLCLTFLQTYDVYKWRVLICFPSLFRYDGKSAITRLIVNNASKEIKGSTKP